MRFATRILVQLGLVLELCAVPLLLTEFSQLAYSQSSLSRIHFAGKNIFASGINIAWVDFASDLGATPNLAQFATEFQTVRANGGNVMRFWLHTNGSQTPVYNSNGMVSGPGQYAIQDLKQILTLAWQNHVGLILCLWTHNMLSQQQLSGTYAPILNDNLKLLTDTSYTMAYIRNALIPMVDSLKGNPAIVAWEIFNEPEGITSEYGPWSGLLSVDISDIQRCINLMAGAIHRADPNALVTSGANTFQTMTDVNPPASTKLSDLETLSSMPALQQKEIVDAFNARHRLNLTPAEWLAYMKKISAIPNENFYRDDRLIAIGGDNLGVLDFYSVHYYSQGSGVSPFVHPYSYWGLTKPVVVAEFYMQATDGFNDQSLFPTLYNDGYAGALVWSWTDFGNPPTNSKTDTWLALKYMLANHHGDVIISPETGTIYDLSANPSTIQKTDSTFLRWDVEPGSMMTLNGQVISIPKDSIRVSPLVTTKYTLVATGEVINTATTVVTVLPSGTIMSFQSIPEQIGTGESAVLIWQVVKGSSVTLNGQSTSIVDTMVVHPTTSSNTYTLVAKGDVQDSMTITIPVSPPDQVDRAMGAAITVSSNDTIADPYSNPQFLVDGNNFSRWQSGSSASQWVKLDLGISYSMSKIVIYWGNKAYAKQYKVQVSDDDSTWTQIAAIYTGTGGNNYVETLSELTGTGRYVYLLLQAEGNGAYSIAEISIYGVPSTSGVDELGSPPTKYSLSQNYPNPFNPSTLINYQLPVGGRVTLKVYDILGREVAVLVNGLNGAGYHSLRFDGSNLASGVYFLRMTAGQYTDVKKMILLR